MSRPPRALTLDQIETLRSEYVAGAHVDALAHRYGIGRSTVYAYIGVGVRTDAERARDERNARMRAARAAGATYTEIAAAHGLSRQAVQQLLTAIPPRR